MENSLNNKAKFFSLYWGLNCISNDDFVWHGQETLETALKASKGDLSGWYATLKSLKDINDEDAFKIGFGNKNSFLAINKELYIYHVNSVDYLRSKGYALPWMELSIEQLIEYGWVKVKESEV